MHRFMRGFRHRFWPEGKQGTLAWMRAGQSGIVVEIRGGHGLVSRLSALGIRPGKRITKVSSMLMRGPVTVQVDNAQLAIGFRMAMDVIVELD
jgi:ferrous iron transport protein A